MESFCWAFDCCERDVDEELAWRYSIYEMIQKVQTRLGFETSMVLCHHSSMVDIVSAAFGGGGKAAPGKLPEGVNDLGQAGSYQGALSQINGALNWG